MKVLPGTRFVVRIVVPALALTCLAIGGVGLWYWVAAILDGRSSFEDGLTRAVFSLGLMALACGIGIWKLALRRQMPPESR